MEQKTNNREVAKANSHDVVAFQDKRCIIMRNGSEIWIPTEKAVQLQNALIKGDRGFVKLTDAGDRIINMVDISEFLSQDQMNDRAKLKSGEWKCDKGGWHQKKEKCNCIEIANKKNKEIVENAHRREALRPNTPEEIESTTKTINNMRANLVEKFGMKFAKKRKR